MAIEPLNTPIQPKPTERMPLVPLPYDRLERVSAWGMNTSVCSYVYRPTTIEGVREVFETARAHGRKVALRGSGCSYGDASLLAENISLDLTRMNRILAWSPETGVITVEPGATIRDIWRYVIEDGWWSPVVSGTMMVSLGGALGMNIHGKNNFRVGPIGDHVVEFDLLTPKGEILRCSRTENTELFYTAIGGFGMLGCFVRITLQLKKIYSGQLSVHAFATADLRGLFQEFEARMGAADYLVAWVDCFAKGKALGRSLVHQADYLPKGVDPVPAQTLRVQHQDLPETLFGVIPKSLMWRFLKPFSNNWGMRLVNTAKYTQGSTLGNNKTHRQAHAAFAFLLDYVPNWKFIYKPGGLIQYQSFVPAETAEACFTAQLEACHKAGTIPYLGVFKRHRKDGFLISHAVDGYSFALDIPITEKSREKVWDLAKELNRLVLQAGGRFYFAKDSTLDSETARAYLGDAALVQFRRWKQECDPENLLQTSLSRRLFGETWD